MRSRATLAAVALLALAAWPAVGRAEEPPPTTDVPTDTTVEPVTTTTEVPATTTTTAPPAPTTTAPPVVDEPAPEGGPRTLTVTPHQNLVHDQVVVLRGRGWPPHQGGQGAAQCITGITDTRGCGPVKFFPVDAAGNFRTTLRVSVLLETSIGTFDCRVDQCVIGSNYTPSAAGARFVNLTFDPAGPDPTRRTVTVSPDTDLVDGQEVTVTGDGFQGGWAELVQCRLPALDIEADCDTGTFDGARAPGGHLDHTLALEGLLRLGGGVDHDCRTGDCVLLVKAFDEPYAEAALAPLGFDPSGPLRPPPTLVVDPATDLVDGDLVGVTGAGWDEGLLYLAMCRAGAVEFDDCSYEFLEFADVTDVGDVNSSFAVRTRITLGDGTRLDCRVDACSLLGAQDETFRRTVEVPLAFDPDGGLVDITVEVTPSTGLRDGDVVTVRGEGRPVGEMYAVQCVGHATDYRDCDIGTIDGIGGGPDAAPRRAPRLHPFEGRVEVRRELQLSGGGTVDCALTPCVLVVAEDFGFDVAGRAALDFARGAAGGSAGGPITGSPTFAG